MADNEDDAAVGTFVDNISLVALSAAVHADVLQHRVDQLRHVQQQIGRDAAEIEALEEQLHDATKSAERVAVMSKALADARTASRVPGAQGRSGAWADKPEAHAALSNNTPMQDILKFAKTAEAFDGESSATGSLMTAVESTQAQVGRLHAALETRRRSSVREKLAVLESLKATCRHVHVHETLEATFGALRFPSAADAYFFGASPGTATSNSEARQRKDRSFGATESRTGSGQHSKKNKQPDTVVSRSNILQLLRQASRRLSLRYGDALDVLGSSMDRYKSVHPSSMTPQDEERLLYASDFSQRLSRLDVESVRLCAFLHDAAHVDTALADEYSRCCQDWVASRPAVPRSQQWHNNVLNPECHIALPKSWSTARMLRTTEDTDDEGFIAEEAGCNDEPAAQNPIEAKPPLLPPARHILTQRFSASDAAELCALQQHRMDVQRRVLEQVLAIPRAVRDAVPRLGRVWQEQQHGKRGKAVWPVLASVEPTNTDA